MRKKSWVVLSALLTAGALAPQSGLADKRDANRKNTPAETVKTVATTSSTPATPAAEKGGNVKGRVIDENGN